MATVADAWTRPPLGTDSGAEPRTLTRKGYDKELARLQVELVRLQEWIVH